MALYIARSNACSQCIQKIARRHASTSSVFEAYSTDTSAKPPPYPYGPSLRHKVTNTGLYGGAQIQFGHKVSEKNEHKNRRVWLPNIHRKRLWSPSLNRFVRVKINISALRTIDKLGGLDEYLVGSDSPARIKELGVTGWKLRWEVMQTEAYKERARKERERLGLPVEGWLVAENNRKRAELDAAVAAARFYMQVLAQERAAAAVEAEILGDEDESSDVAPIATRPKDATSDIRPGREEVSRDEEEVAAEGNDDPDVETEPAPEKEESPAAFQAREALDEHAKRVESTRSELMEMAREVQQQIEEEARTEAEEAAEAEAAIQRASEARKIKRTKKVKAAGSDESNAGLRQVNLEKSKGRGPSRVEDIKAESKATLLERVKRTWRGSGPA